ncbi:MAG: TlpA family protein disulfide reductase [Kofleriaceae bacterium]
MIALVVLATQLRGLVGAGWLATAVDVGLGARAAIQVLTRALTVELGFLVVAALVLFAAGGKRRNLGRAFDLACVAALPMFYVALIATVVVRALELSGVVVDLPREASIVIAGASYAWAGVLVALAIRPARRGLSGSAARSTSVERAVTAAQVPTKMATRAGAAVLAVVLIGAAVQVGWLASNMEEMRPMTNGDRAPAFALPLIAKGGTPGAQITLAQHRGKIVVLDFWATWCGPCIRAMPKLESLARRYAGQVEVIAINLDDFAKARSMFDEGGYRMTLVGDDGQVSTRYGVSTIPHSVVIDRDGIVRRVYRGSTSKLTDDIEAQLRK